MPPRQSATRFHEKIQYLLYNEGRIWCAQCVEHDICAQGSTKADALNKLNDMIEDYIELGKRARQDFISKIPPYPQNKLKTLIKLVKDQGAQIELSEPITKKEDTAILVSMTSPTKTLFSHE